MMFKRMLKKSGNRIMGYLAKVCGFTEYNILFRLWRNGHKLTVDRRQISGVTFYGNKSVISGFVCQILVRGGRA